MWSHLIVVSLYSERWQSALWLCSVRWALRRKPYTGKVPWWPWLVKCSHFHQEGASVQRPLSDDKLLLAGQLKKTSGGDSGCLILIVETVKKKWIRRAKTQYKVRQNSSWNLIVFLHIYQAHHVFHRSCLQHSFSSRFKTLQKSQHHYYKTKKSNGILTHWFKILNYALNWQVSG